MPMPRHGHALLAALLAATAAATSAQPSYDDYGQQVHVSTALIALLAAVIAVFVFIAFFTIYLRHCTGGYAARQAGDGDDGRRATPNFDAFISRSRRQRRMRGLDAEVVEAFPTMKYAEAKAEGAAGRQAGRRRRRARVRGVPQRVRGRGPAQAPAQVQPHLPPGLHRRVARQPRHLPRLPLQPRPLQAGHQQRRRGARRQFPVDSSGEQHLQRDRGGRAGAAAGGRDDRRGHRGGGRGAEAGGAGAAADRDAAASSNKPVPTQLARSHSTGHSLAVRLDRDLERFTLRLPEHVRREMVAAGEHHSMQLRRLGRRAAGEGSSRGGGGGGRSATLGRPGRWQSLLARTFSGKLSFFSASRMTVSSELGEVSSSSSTRARGKRVAAVDAAAAVPSIRLDRFGGGGRSGVKAGAAFREVAAAAADEEEKKAATQQVRT